MSRENLYNSDFFYRIDQLRKHLDIPMYVFAELTGVSQSFMSELKAGLFDNISNLNIYWLFFGKGEMFLPEKPANNVKEAPGSYTKQPLTELQKLFKEAEQRPKEEQEAIVNMVKGILQLVKK